MLPTNKRIVYSSTVRLRIERSTIPQFPIRTVKSAVTQIAERKGRSTVLYFSVRIGMGKVPRSAIGKEGVQLHSLL